jgi:hypothetical protein
MCRGVANPRTNRGRPAKLGYLILARRGPCLSSEMTVRWVGAFAGVLALAVLGWAAPSGAASPVVSISSEFLPSGQPTVGRRPDS